VERHSRFTALVKVRSKDTAAVVAALSRQIRRLPTSLRRSLTWDRGLEMAKHKTFTVATNVKVYFCDPHSPWQRGTNENTNCCGNTCRSEPTFPATRNPNWTRSRCV
jgi:IS30 family transposase